MLRLAASVQKGGTGKTTSIAHLGVALADRGLDVVLIDLAGKQGDLAKVFGLQEAIAESERRVNIATTFQEEWVKIKELLDEDENRDDALDQLTYDTGEGPDLIPAHEGLDSLDTKLRLDYDDDAVMYSVLDRLLDDLGSKYDAALVDLPGVSNNITLNGLWACGAVLCPVEPARIESEQADALVRDLESFQTAYAEDLPREVRLAMLLPNKTDDRTRLTQKFLDHYAERFPEEIAPVPIPESQDIRNAADQGSTVFALDSPSKTAKRAREAYRLNAGEILDRLGADTDSEDFRTDEAHHDLERPSAEETLQPMTREQRQGGTDR